MHIIRISDGLGNQMFQYAFARKLQILTGDRIYLDARYINHEDVFDRGERDCFHKKCDCREYGLNHLRITLPLADERILSHWKFLNRNTETEKLVYKLSEMNFWPFKYKDEWKEKKVFNKRDTIWPTYFQGNFFNLNYFDDIKVIIQKEFRVSNSIRLSNQMYAILKNENTVSLHIRRRDFVKVFRDISQTNYYPKAIEKINEKIENPIFLIFSDDIDWVKENLNIKGRKIYVSGTEFKDYEELEIMKKCRHNIIANSTFSYWGAYLNRNPGKVVICPKNWKAEIIPSDWLRV